jgi:hypothetical protein
MAREWKSTARLRLQDAKLADPRWKLAFDQVTARRCTRAAVSRRRGLAVRHEGEPGKLSLRAGTGFVRDPGHVFEAGLDASMGAVEADRSRRKTWAAEAVSVGTLAVDDGRRHPVRAPAPDADPAAAELEPGRHAR